jgi:hypothetical protein
MIYETDKNNYENRSGGMTSFRPPVLDELESLSSSSGSKNIEHSPPFKFKSDPPIRNVVTPPHNHQLQMSINVERSEPQPDLIYDTTIGPKYASNLPAVIDYSLCMSPASRSTGINSLCYAGAALMEFHTKKRMSAGWIARHRSDIVMRAREVMNILYNYGCCTEVLYPSDGSLSDMIYKPKGLSKLTSKPSESQLKEMKLYEVAAEEAGDYLIAAFAKIKYQLGKTTDNITILQRSLYENGPAIITLPVYNYHTQPWIPSAISNGNRVMGGIGMCVVGYNHAGFILRNCWGPDWGNVGNTLLLYDDFLTRIAWDIYTLVLDTDHVWDEDGRVAKAKSGCCTMS